MEISITEIVRNPRKLPPQTCRLKSKFETNNSSTYAAHNSSNSDNNDSDNMNNNHHHSMLQAAVPTFLPNTAPPVSTSDQRALHPSHRPFLHLQLSYYHATGTPWKVTFHQSKSLVTGNQPASRLTTYPAVGLGGLLDPMTTIDTEQLLHVSDGKLSCRTPNN